MKSLGFVEVSGVVAAVDALDIMCKSADVSLVSWERKLGGRLVTLIVTGNVSAVTAAVESAKASCIKKPCATAVIANPHSETVRLAELSAKRLEKKTSETKTDDTNEPKVDNSVKAPAKKPAAKKNSKKADSSSESPLEKKD
jgi:microcompartment protein CcmL/EutN